MKKPFHKRISIYGFFIAVLVVACSESGHLPTTYQSVVDVYVGPVHGPVKQIIERTYEASESDDEIVPRMELQVLRFEFDILQNLVYFNTDYYLQHVGSEYLNIKNLERKYGDSNVLMQEKEVGYYTGFAHNRSYHYDQHSLVERIDVVRTTTTRYLPVKRMQNVEVIYHTSPLQRIENTLSPKNVQQGRNVYSFDRFGRIIAFDVYDANDYHKYGDQWDYNENGDVRRYWHLSQGRHISNKVVFEYKTRDNMNNWLSRIEKETNVTNESYIKTKLTFREIEYYD